ncbi:MAG: neutral zinc metallopeptidase [Deltaproteobacteria bacterium]|nr:neutral zinc metallopeptidase [Kofleriaceae bacterium]
MRWDRSHTSPDLEDRRAFGPARGARLGGGNLFGIFALLSRFGWKGILIGLVVGGLLMFGGNLCAGGGGMDPQRSRSVTDTRDTAEDELVRFVGFVFDDVQTFWQREVPGYDRARIVVFRGAVDSACGTTSSAVGPFYCPLDHKAYIDLGFYRELERRFGAPGDFAQAYVIAHELGHHLQNQAGVLGRTGTDSVDTELQADCLAGAWAASARKRQLLEMGDFEEALGAAAAIGDDTIQKKTQGYIQPETWTHGSSRQRVAAFRTGFEGGSARACGL